MISQVMEFQLSYLKILKNEAVKVLYSICQQIWKTQQWPQCWKRSVFIPMPKKGNSKEFSTCHAIVLISLASKVMFKIPQAKLQHYMNWELSDVQTGSRNQRANWQHPLDHRESKGIPENISVCFTDYAKAFHKKDHNKLWKILKEMGVPDHLTCLLKSLYVGQKVTVRIICRTTGKFKTGKEAWQGVHSHSGYLTSIQDTSFNIMDCINPKLE